MRGFKRLPELIEGIRFQDGMAVIMEPDKAEETQQGPPDSNQPYTRFDYFPNKPAFPVKL